jgi:hypothetical protein
MTTEQFNQDNPNAVKGAGISGGRSGLNLATINTNIIAAELALNQIGNFEPLDYKLDTSAINQVITEKYSNDWVDYLPRTDRPNNRKAMTLTTIRGWDHMQSPSIPEVAQRLGRTPSETEFCNPTQLYQDCDQAAPGLTSLKSFLDEWQPLGRTFIINSGIGGYFVPHRDHPGLPRACFRLVAFLKNCGPYDYDWWMDDRKANIEIGRVYYVNTRMTHRTISWVNDSWHLILNVPFSPNNVDRVLKHLQHRH